MQSEPDLEDNLIRISQSELDRACIRSPQAGTVIKTTVRPGETVSSDEGIARIGQIKNMYAVAEIYESDINKLTAAATALPIVLPVSRAITVLVLTMIMCGVSGAIATRKLQSANPADIF